ncbi:MAG: carbohydrate kinase family protein [Desulfovermiculus sp.]|nr:carbohydrate kinase family protein [Desulfovermiculus sp.]
MSIYISGSLAYDRIMNFPDKFSNHILPDKLHILNVCFLVNDLEERFGGTAGNIAYSLALLEEKATILAAAGNDFERYQNWLQKHGISQDGIHLVQDVPTASAYITTDHADNQITAFNPGAMNTSTNGFQSQFETKDSLAIVSPGNLEDMQKFPEIYRGKNIPFIFDPGQNIPAFSGAQLKSMIQGSTILIANDYELSLIMEATGLDKKGLLQLTSAIITTLGEQGCLITNASSEQEIPAVKVQNAQDPTGCGDAFRSGLIKGLCRGKGLKEAAQMGATCACFCVEHKGTQEHRFTVDQFWNRYSSAYQ